MMDELQDAIDWLNRLWMTADRADLVYISTLLAHLEKGGA